MEMDFCVVVLRWNTVCIGKWQFSCGECNGKVRSCIQAIEDCSNFLKPNIYYMYRHFNIQQFYVLPTQCIYVFYVDLRTNSDYFPIQH